MDLGHFGVSLSISVGCRGAGCFLRRQFRSET